MRVKPADPDVVIRDPHTKRALPAEGGDVPDSSFWNRRLRSGEVVRIDDDATPDDETKSDAPTTTKGTQPLPRTPRAPGAGVDIANEPEPPVGNEPLAPLTTRKPRS